MADIIPFSINGALPAHLRSESAPESSLAAFGGAGYPFLSIEGKTFHLIENGVSNLIPWEPGSTVPAPFVDAVIIALGPEGRLSGRVYYDHQYVPGSNEKPTCFSNDGKFPDIHGERPQSASCSGCPHDIVGSGATATNAKRKTCASVKRLAIVLGNGNPAR